MAGLFSSLGFGPQATIEIEIGDEDSRQQIELTRDSGKLEKVLLYVGDDDRIFGTARVNVKDGKKVEHTGIKCELVGQVELFYDRGNHYEFISQVRELAPAGVLDADLSADFDFPDVEKQFESYNGINVRLRYFVRVTVGRSFSSNIVKERDLWVFVYPEPPEINNTIKMEVGIEDCLHIEFEYGKSKYHLKDVVIGKIYFLLVRIKIKHMEIALIKRESTGSGPNVYNESETLTKFEIMDGAPVRGESIPVRLFLGGFELTPTYRSVHNKFSLKYYLNLVLVDEEDRRYFKQQEITLWRKMPGGMRHQPTQAYSGKREAAAARQKEAKQRDIEDKLRKKKEKEEARRREYEKKHGKSKPKGDDGDGGGDGDGEKAAKGDGDADGDADADAGGATGGGDDDDAEDSEERRRREKKAKKKAKKEARRRAAEAEAAAAAAAEADGGDGDGDGDGDDDGDGDGDKDGGGDGGDGGGDDADDDDKDKKDAADDGDADGDGDGGDEEDDE